MTDRPTPPASGNQMLMLMGMMLMMLVIINKNMRKALGNLAGSVLEPTLAGLGVASFLTLTLLVCGSLMMITNTIVRHFALDPLAQAQMQKKASFISKEMREARASGNKYKERALQEMQPQILQEQSTMMTNQMKTMIPTSLIAISIFTALFIIVEAFSYNYVSNPFTSRWDLNGKFLWFPNWIVLYMFLTAPVSIIITRSLRLYDFSHRLEDARAEAELTSRREEEESQERSKRREERKKRREERRGEPKETLSGKAGEPKKSGKKKRPTTEKTPTKEVGHKEDMVCPACESSDVRDFRDGSYKCRECQHFFLDG